MFIVDVHKLRSFSQTAYVIAMLLALFSVASFAQEHDEYQKWLKKEQEKFREFKDARDKEFYEFLKHEWKQMQAFRGLVPDEKPKPRVMPVYERPAELPKEPSSKPAEVWESIPSGKDIPSPKPIDKPQPTLRSEPPLEAKKNAAALSITFFDTPLSLVYEKFEKSRLGTQIDKEAISLFWAAMSNSNYEAIIAQARDYQARMKLNDWGYALLAHAIGEQFFNSSRNEAVLFTWFVLTKSGYEAKVGYVNDRVFLMLHTGNSLYYVPYFSMGEDKKRFYVVPLNAKDAKFEGSLYTYDGSYPGATRLVDFKIQSAPVLQQNTSTKTLRFVHDRKEYTLPVKFSRDAVAFFEYYPQTNYEVYFTAVPSPEATASLLSALRPLVEGKTEWEAVNIVLHFVQTAFEYKTDPEQFGREKPLFPDETLYYPYSDCEDRAILFAYLVRNLLGLEVVGLDYPAHIATAVRFSTEIAGDIVIFQGKRYVICDPTFINADVGACMPQFKGVDPNVIRIE